jgi:hypothetical protein
MPHWIEINRAPVLTLWAAVVAIVVLLADFTVLVSMPAGDLPRPILVLKAATSWLPKIRKDFKKLTN